MSESVHVAFDLGAESGRAILGSFDGHRLVVDEVRRFPTRAVRLPDGLYWDALALFDDMTSVLADIVRSGASVRSLGIDSWGVDFGLLDDRGALIANPLSYRDERGAAAMRQALELVPADEIYAITGIQFLPINSLYQLLALAGAGTLERAETLLLVPDLLRYWLTGETYAEVTNASTTQLLDARTGGWSTALLERFELPSRILPPIVEAGSLVETLLPHVADATGLPGSTPVVAVASHDTASAVVATPLSGTAAAYISSGTWSPVGVELNEPVLTPAAGRANMTNERGFAGTTRLLKNVMGLWLVQECRRAWGREGEAPSYAQLTELAAGAESGVLFDPDLPELLVPGDMPERIRVACARLGQEPPAGRAELLRSILDSLACKYRVVLDELEEVSGRTIESLHVIGGGARNDLLCSLTANIARRTVLAGPVEAAAFGNVLVQLHAFGEVSSPAEMRALVSGSTEIRVFEPDAAEERWEGLYDRFRRLVDSEVAPV